jgi:CHRD domain
MFRLFVPVESIAFFTDRVDLLAGKLSGSQCVPRSGLQGGVWGEAGVRIDWEKREANVHLVHTIDSTQVLVTSQPVFWLGREGLNGGERLWMFNTIGITGALQGSGVSPVVGTVSWEDGDLSEADEQRIRFALQSGDAYLTLGVVAGSVTASQEIYAECAIRAQVRPAGLLGSRARFEATLSDWAAEPEVRGSARVDYDFDSGEVKVEVKWEDSFTEDEDLLDVHLQFGETNGEHGLEVFALTLDTTGGRAKKATAKLFVNRYTIEQLFHGEVYANVSTEASPSGALFGQFYWDWKV